MQSQKLNSLTDTERRKFNFKILQKYLKGAVIWVNCQFKQKNWSQKLQFTVPMKDAGFTLQEQQTTKTQVLLVIIVCLKISGLLFG